MTRHPCNAYETAAEMCDPEHNEAENTCNYCGKPLPIGVDFCDFVCEGHFNQEMKS